MAIAQWHNMAQRGSRSMHSDLTSEALQIWRLYLCYSKALSFCTWQPCSSRQPCESAQFASNGFRLDRSAHRLSLLKTFQNLASPSTIHCTQKVIRWYFLTRLTSVLTFLLNYLFIHIPTILGVHFFKWLPFTTYQHHTQTAYALPLANIRSSL